MQVMTDTATKYAIIHANLATHQLIAGESVPITSGVVTFTPTSTSHDAQTVYTACEVKGYLVDGVLRTHAHGGARGVQLLAGRYDVQISARSATARQTIIDCVPITVQPGQEINLAALMDDGVSPSPAPSPAPVPQPAGPAREWVAVDLGDGTAKIIERDKNE